MRFTFGLRVAPVAAVGPAGLAQAQIFVTHEPDGTDPLRVNDQRVRVTACNRPCVCPARAVWGGGKSAVRAGTRC